MSCEITVIHKFDGPATALLEKLVVALSAPSVTITDAIGDLSHTETTRTGTAARKPDEEVVIGTPARERGKPSPGKKRRTKAEVAEDEAAAVANGGGVTPPEPATPAEPKGPTIDDVRDRVRAYHKAQGPEAVKAIFDGLSGGSIQTIKDAADLPTIIERIDAAEAAAGPPAGSTAGSFD